VPDGLLNLVLELASAERKLGFATAMSIAPDVHRLKHDVRDLRERTEAEVQRRNEQAAGWMEQARHQAEKRDELFAEVERLKAVAPGQTEQARDIDGDPLWLHQCGTVDVFTGQPSPDDCASCYRDHPGPWRPLLVAVPQQDGPQDGQHA